MLRYDLAVDKGAFLIQVTSNSPADKAGLAVGDVIVGFGDKEITDAHDFTQAIHSSQIGEEVKITFWRGDTEQTTFATLIESPPS